VLPAEGGTGGLAGFLLTVGAVFGYTAGWSPYAADYARYLPADSSRVRTGLAAGVGMFVSTSVLMVVGAASVCAATGAGLASDNPTANFTGLLPGWLGALTLLAIVIGAVAANVLNVYSGAMAFLCLGIDVPLAKARAAVAVGFGVVGFVIAFLALADAAHGYENFLLVIVYWIGPWLGITLADMYLRRSAPTPALLYDRRYTNHAGLIALVVVSVLLFANQQLYTGIVAAAVPQIGDVGFITGFIVAAGLYTLLFRRLGRHTDARV
jgi:nucleobase:cation symporter-1, NCS1 family